VFRVCGGEKQLGPAGGKEGAWTELVGTARMRGLVVGFTL